MSITSAEIIAGLRSKAGDFEAIAASNTSGWSLSLHGCQTLAAILTAAADALAAQAGGAVVSREFLVRCKTMAAVAFLYAPVGGDAEKAFKMTLDDIVAALKETP